MSWDVAPAVQTLRDQLDEAFPGRGRPDGTIGDAAHAARKSEHNPDADRLVCAVDLKRLTSKLSNLEIANALRLSRDPRTLYVIADGRMFSSYPARGVAPFTWRPYSGVNPHAEHVHLSVTQAGKRSTAPWKAVAVLAAWQAHKPTPAHQPPQAPAAAQAPVQPPRKARTVELVTPDGIRMFLTDGIHAQHVVNDAQLVERCELLGINPRKPQRITEATLAGLVHVRPVVA